MTDSRQAAASTRGMCEEVENGAPFLTPITKIVVAIHGIGSQRRSNTVRAVAERFGCKSHPPIPTMPLGYFHVGDSGEVHVSRLVTDDPLLSCVGFAEVFWADIPKQVVKDDDKLEDTKAWGKSVASRAQAMYCPEREPHPLTPKDLQLGVGVLEEIIETIKVLENLTMIADKAGIFKFSLAPTLRDYVGDVQLVTDFKYYRDRIVHRFHDAMDQIAHCSDADKPELYIVAHSEGTVVSLLGLLQAFTSSSIPGPTKEDRTVSTAWVRQTRGFMTFGSPIDKHLALWPSLWDEFKGKLQTTLEQGRVLFATSGRRKLLLDRPIQWRNYYDLGDPIGFKLDSARSFLKEEGCAAFEFDAQAHDLGFSRYTFPGKAHNDYWEDDAVFEHFMQDVVFRPADGMPPDGASAPPPTSRPHVRLVSTTLPYLLTGAVHFVAMFVLLKALASFMGAGVDAGAAPSLSVQVPMLSLLLLGVTVTARLPRLIKARGPFWPLVGCTLFLVAAVPYALVMLHHHGAAFLGQGFTWLPGLAAQPRLAGVVGPLLAASITALIGWCAPRRPGTARLLMLSAGALAIVAIVAGRLLAVGVDMPVWPVLLAGAAFLYLWWLGILLFDLAFIWHRYIRHNIAVDTLAKWAAMRDAAALERAQSRKQRQPSERVAAE